MINDLLKHKDLITKMLLCDKEIITNIMGIELNDKLILDYYHTLGRIELCDAFNYEVITSVDIRDITNYTDSDEDGRSIDYPTFVSKLVNNENYKVWLLKQFVKN